MWSRNRRSCGRRHLRQQGSETNVCLYALRALDLERILVEAEGVDLISLTDLGRAIPKQLDILERALKAARRRQRQ